MKIAVCLNLLPDARDIKVLDDGTLVRDDARIVLSQGDAYALEAARVLARDCSGTVQAFCLNPYKDVPSQLYREVLSRGADELFVIEDDRLDSMDEHGIAELFTAFLERWEKYDLILCGTGAAECDMDQVCFGIGALMGIPALNEVELLSVESGKLFCNRWLETEIQSVIVPLPAVCSITSSASELAAPGLMELAKANKKPITAVALPDIGFDDIPDPGFRVLGFSDRDEQPLEDEAFFPVLTMLKMLRSGNRTVRRHVMLPGSPAAAASELVDALARENVL